MPGAKEGAEVAKQAGENILTSGLLGSIAILCLAIAVAAIYLLYKTQNKRVADLTKYAEELKELNAAQKDFHTGTNKALEGMERAAGANNSTLQTIQQNTNNLMLLLAKNGGGT